MKSFLSGAARWFGRQVNGLLPLLYPFFQLVSRGWLFTGWWHFLRDLQRYRRQSSGDFPIQLCGLYPQLYDRYAAAGSVATHYFLQDLWAARKVCESGVKVHYDVGSRLDGFVAHCLTFCRVILLDIRPLPWAVDNLEFQRADATAMTEIESGSLRSLSSLHALEHFGLGRYGDSIDPAAHRRAASEFVRVLAPGGRLYFSAPVGRQRLEFNAHRIFDPATIPPMFAGLELIEFSVIDDRQSLHLCQRLTDHRHHEYACGLFLFEKPGRAVVRER